MAPPFTVLVVDDDYTFSDYLRLVLSPDQWRVSTCQEPLEAGAAALQLRPDVILLDLMMPQMNGLEVLLWLKERAETRHIPVVVCSVNMEWKVAKEVAALGGVDALAKPLNKQDLMAVLGRAVPASRAA
jgi:CheY-like chemotaxis protein